jgi:hypothetical protein
MFAIIIFILILILIISLFYGATQIKKNLNKGTPLAIGLYTIATLMTLLWLYYGFLFVTIIMKGV